MNWLPSWSATRLHAVSGQPELIAGKRTTLAACGVSVYPNHPMQWAVDRIAAGLQRCKTCERIAGG